MHKTSWAILLSILASTMITGCSTSHKDGPPGYYVDVSKIPNAKPKREPRAKYGNMRSYKVFGKRYYTLKSSKNYDKVGTASWYGKKFHSRLTSSRERYDMLSMTAAHKTLPLPTYVEVTNLRNKRKVVVKVNDRGPFKSNRLIDLSYVAAKKLGMVGRGTTKVRVRAINPDSYNKPRLYAKHKKTKHSLVRRFAKRKSTHRATKHKSSPIFLQVGAFKNLTYAQKLKHKLSPHVDAPILISRPGGGSTLYRVRIGPIRTASLGNEIQDWLDTHGIEAKTVM